MTRDRFGCRCGFARFVAGSFQFRARRAASWRAFSCRAFSSISSGGCWSGARAARWRSGDAFVGVGRVGTGRRWVAGAGGWDRPRRFSRSLFRRNALSSATFPVSASAFSSARGVSGKGVAARRRSDVELAADLGRGRSRVAAARTGTNWEVERSSPRWGVRLRDNGGRGRGGGGTDGGVARGGRAAHLVHEGGALVKVDLHREVALIESHAKRRAGGQGR